MSFLISYVRLNGRSAKNGSEPAIQLSPSLFKHCDSFFDVLELSLEVLLVKLEAISITFQRIDFAFTEETTKKSAEASSKSVAEPESMALA